MILKQLVLQDYGVYGGEHVIDLTPADQNGEHRPIILFGGKNGAGKTTILEAVKVCLFGRLALGNRVRQSDYHAFLDERIHRPHGAILQPTGAQIRLEFDYVHAGEGSTYQVTRSWDRVGQDIEEELDIQQDGQPLTDLSSAHWDDFLRDFVPPGLSELFFFDGEKIQRLARQNGDAQALAESFRALLGLNLVERLQDDLNVYVTRQPDERAQYQQLQERIGQLQNEREKIETELERTRRQLDDTREEISEAQEQIQELEQEIASQGGAFAAQRDALKSERVDLRQQVAQLERQIQDLCNGVLPFALAPSLSAALKEQLQAEERYQRWAASQEILNHEFGAVSRQLREPEFWHEVPEDVPDTVREQVADFVSARLEQLMQTPADVEQVQMVHHVSEPERQQLIGWIDEALEEVPAQIHDVVETLKSFNTRLEQIELDLQRVPDDDMLAPLIEEITQCQGQLDQLYNQSNGLERHIASLEYRLEEMERELKRAYEKARAEESVGERLKLASRVQLALNDYLTELTTLKVRELEEAATEYFNRLCRKEDLVHHIAISESDFSVTLFSKGGAVRRSSELSAGERQIYAIALLWALRHVSGRPLPVIIDTPLARLDSDHRRSVVEQYLPNVSHQVIVLSTDTEVDKPLFSVLEPHIAKAYHLSYDPVQGKTERTEGYFWTHRNGRRE